MAGQPATRCTGAGIPGPGGYPRPAGASIPVPAALPSGCPPVAQPDALSALRVARAGQLFPSGLREGTAHRHRPLAGGATGRCDRLRMCSAAAAWGARQTARHAPQQNRLGSAARTARAGEGFALRAIVSRFVLALGLRSSRPTGVGGTRSASRAAARPTTHWGQPAAVRLPAGRAVDPDTGRRTGGALAEPAPPALAIVGARSFSQPAASPVDRIWLLARPRFMLGRARRSTSGRRRFSAIAPRARSGGQTA